MDFFLIFFVFLVRGNIYLCGVEMIFMTSCKSIDVSELYCIGRIQAFYAVQDARLQRFEAER